MEEKIKEEEEERREACCITACHGCTAASDSE